MAPKNKSLISVPKRTWDEAMKALELITNLKEWLTGDQEEIPDSLKNLIRRNKKGTIDVKIWCVLCTENHTLHLNINKKDDVTRQLCQHSTFQYSRIK